MYIRKVVSEINNLSFHMRKVEKEKQLSWKQAEEKEKKLEQKLMKLKTGKKRKSTKSKIGFSKRSIKLIKL